jgi:hypothetical protein
MNLEEIEWQLKQRIAYPYIWGRKQSDDWDSLTSFIYQISKFEDLLIEITNRFKSQSNYDALFNYAINRWYNFWSAMAVEKIFCALPNIKPALNPKNRLVDFEIKGFPFDHKTSVFPSGYDKTLKEARENPKDLILWLYRNQSQEQRMHMGNRLFIVLYSTDGNHWKLKAEILWLKQIIENYVNNFDADKLHKFNFDSKANTLSDIIWAIKTL